MVRVYRSGDKNWGGGVVVHLNLVRNLDKKGNKVRKVHCSSPRETGLATTHSPVNLLVLGNIIPLASSLAREVCDKNQTNNSSNKKTSAGSS